MTRPARHGRFVARGRRPASDQESDSRPRLDFVAKTRIVVISAGVTWPLVAVVYGTVVNGDFWFSIIAVMLMVVVFGIPALVLACLVPTQRSRLVIAPAFLLISFAYVTSNNSDVNYAALLWLLPWLLTFTAVALVPPEVPLISRLYRKLSGSRLH